MQVNAADDKGRNDFSLWPVATDIFLQPNVWVWGKTGMTVHGRSGMIDLKAASSTTLVVTRNTNLSLGLFLKSSGEIGNCLSVDFGLVPFL